MAGEKATRQAWADELIELGRSNRDIFVLDADLSASTYGRNFGKAYPDRYFNLGVCEQNMVSIAAGMALDGKIACAASFSCFLIRAMDQIRVSLCYSDTNVKLMGSHSGLLTGEDGATAQCLEDIAMFRALPNMKIAYPADYNEARAAIREMVCVKGPVYLRTARQALPYVFPENHVFKFGKGNVVADGKDVSIIAAGPILSEAVNAAGELKKDGISARVIGMASIKPIDESLIEKAAKETGAIVSCEDHSIYGGLGGAIAEVLAAKMPAPLERIGTRDTFGESGKPLQLWEKYGLTAPSIAKAAKAAIKRK
ncbi:MAG: transketolase family protein [Candidatus Diapherotrites archaeon]|nr:transketolase family protein [Candidatus Diapherotrites archaeon]